MSPLRKIFRDPSFWALIIFNAFIIYQYKEDVIEYTTIIWLYWCQSVLIGIFTFFDMLTLKNVIPDNLKINKVPATAKQSKGCLPLFFLVHYGIFHVVYFVFLLVDFRLSNVNFSVLKWTIGFLFLNQLIYFIQYKTIYRDMPRSIGALFITPYLRIVPMHLTILLPKFFSLTPALTFLILKAVFDLIGHLATTPYYWKKGEAIGSRQ